jgi:hypothetical protein
MGMHINVTALRTRVFCPSLSQAGWTDYALVEVEQATEACLALHVAGTARWSVLNQGVVQTLVIDKFGE